MLPRPLRHSRRRQQQRATNGYASVSPPRSDEFAMPARKPNLLVILIDDLRILGK